MTSQGEGAWWRNTCRAQKMYLASTSPSGSRLYITNPNKILTSLIHRNYTILSICPLSRRTALTNSLVVRMQSQVAPGYREYVFSEPWTHGTVRSWGCMTGTGHLWMGWLTNTCHQELLNSFKLWRELILVLWIQSITDYQHTTTNFDRTVLTNFHYHPTQSVVYRTFVGHYFAV